MLGHALDTCEHTRRLQSSLESAKRAKKDWPNSVFLTIRGAPHVTLATSECALRTVVS